jgi:hypothetical protein
MTDSQTSRFDNDDFQTTPHPQPAVMSGRKEQLGYAEEFDSQDVPTDVGKRQMFAAGSIGSPHHIHSIQICFIVYGKLGRMELN